MISLNLIYDAIKRLQMVDFAAAMAKSAAAAAAVAAAAVEDHDGDSGEWPMMKVSRNVGRSVDRLRDGPLISPRNLPIKHSSLDRSFCELPSLSLHFQCQ